MFAWVAKIRVLLLEPLVLGQQNVVILGEPFDLGRKPLPEEQYESDEDEELTDDRQLQHDRDGSMAGATLDRQEPDEDRHRHEQRDDAPRYSSHEPSGLLTVARGA